MILERLDEMAVSYFLTTLENIVHVDRLLNGGVLFQFRILLFLEGIMKTAQLMC
jgi:hypothetical protein